MKMKNAMFREDYELIYLIHQGDEEALKELIQKYRKILLLYVNQFRSILKKEFDEDELMQISTIALYSAVMTFNEEMNCKFTTYLKVIVIRELQLLVRSLYSLCRKANVEALSLHQYVNENENRYIIDTLRSEKTEYETVDFLHRKEFLLQMEEAIKKCKVFEQRVFSLWRIGMTYEEIARELNCTKKEVDNSVQRFKKKLRSMIDYDTSL